MGGVALAPAQRDGIGAVHLDVVRAIVTGQRFVPVPHRGPGPGQGIVLVVKIIECPGMGVREANLRAAGHAARRLGLQRVVSAAVERRHQINGVRISPFLKQRQAGIAAAGVTRVNVHVGYRTDGARAHVGGLDVDTGADVPLHGEVVGIDVAAPVRLRIRVGTDVGWKRPFPQLQIGAHQSGEASGQAARGRVRINAAELLRNDRRISVAHVGVIGRVDAHAVTGADHGPRGRTIGNAQPRHKVPVTIIHAGIGRHSAGSAEQGQVRIGIVPVAAVMIACGQREVFVTKPVTDS